MNITLYQGTKMMKIEIEIPDWAGERALHILSGNEAVATKLSDGDWYVVTERCNRCGKCCKQYDKVPFECNENGWCPYLYEEPTGEYTCLLGAYRPVGCSTLGPIPTFCNMKMERVECK